MSEGLGDLLADTGADLLEAVLDQAQQDELLKSIPIVGTVLGLIRISATIKDILFAAKVKKFLLSLPQISETTRQTFQKKMQSDEAYRNRVGECLLFTLEKLDSLEKAAMLAKVFASFVNGTINDIVFRRLAAAIELAFIDDLHNLAYSIGLRRYRDLQPLVHTGLVNIYPKINTGSPQFGSFIDDTDISLKISNLGQIFIGIMKN